MKIQFQITEMGLYCAYDQREQVKEISTASRRQADVIEVVKLVEAQDRSSVRLSDEQVAEVQRRRSEDNPETMTLAEFNARLRHRYGI